MKTNKDVSFSERLLARRNRLNLTQPDLAAKAAISARSISDYERGLSEPSMEQLQKLAAALEISVSWLVGEVTPEAGSLVLHDRLPGPKRREAAAAPESPYGWMQTATLENTLNDLVARLKKAGLPERKYILGNMAEVVAELAQREINSGSASDAAKLLKQASASAGSDPSK